MPRPVHAVSLLWTTVQSPSIFRLPNKKPIVLIVDDSTEDLLLARLASKEASTDIEWRMVNSGIDALAYLTGEGRFSDRELYPIPHLVILDLKMPCVSGFDVLSKLKSWKPLRRPAICVLSNSEIKKDIEKATALGVNAFHTKPNDFEGLCTLLGELTTTFCSDNRQPVQAV